MRFEQVDDLMTRLGQVLDPLGIQSFGGSKTWGIALDEDLSLLADLDEGQAKLVLSTEIGQPSAGSRDQLFELLLRHNFLWDQTGGVRFAVDGPDGAVVQIVDVATEGLDVRRLDRVIRGFADMARAWRDVIRRPAAAAGSPAQDFAFPMIRV